MNKGNKKFSVRRLFRSFQYAMRGVLQVFHTEQNAKVHLLAMSCVIIAGLYFGLSRAEWMALIIVCGSVLTAETFNTAIEELSDAVSSIYDERIKRVKDFAAGAVLITAITAVIVGLFIFIPKICSLF